MEIQTIRDIDKLQLFVNDFVDQAKTAEPGTIHLRFILDDFLRDDPRAIMLITWLHEKYPNCRERPIYLQHVLEPLSTPPFTRSVDEHGNSTEPVTLPLRSKADNNEPED